MESKSKKICFFDTPKRHIDLKLRIEYDGFKFSEFMRLLVTAYLERDERLVAFIEEKKEEKAEQNQKKRKDSQKMHERAKENVDKFALNEDEIESIFDMIEREHQEL
jgi:predicted GTPase